MPTLKTPYWTHLTTQDFKALDREKTVAVLPVGAIEQHGPHLPLMVDACLNNGILKTCLQKIDKQTPVLILPEQQIGWSDEHTNYPGTLSVSPETLVKAWEDIGASVYRAGVKKLCFFNTHGGQPQVIDIVARKLRKNYGMLAVRANWWSLGLPEGISNSQELKHGIHGGAIETAMMLHLMPHLVKTQEFQDFPSTTQDYTNSYAHLSATGPTPFAWMAEDLNPAGVSGDPQGVTKEMGKRLVDHAASRLAVLLKEMSDFPSSNLKKAPN